MSAQDIFLGVDAGGSTCRVKITTKPGRVLAEAQSGAANTRIGIEHLHHHLLSTCREAEKMAGLNKTDIAHVSAAMGIAGIQRPGAKDALTGLGFPYKNTHITSDAHIALLGAHSGKDGGVVIVGTGSIGLGTQNGKTKQVGGYGFPVSDEGSGAYIGLQAIKATLKSLDGRVSESPLTQHIFEKFGPTIGNVIAWMDTASATEYATLAPLVVTHAEQGDMTAVSIMKHSGAHITSIIESLQNWGVPTCSIVGGLGKHISAYLLPETIKILKSADLTAIDGALILAQRKA